MMTLDPVRQTYESSLIDPGIFIAGFGTRNTQPLETLLPYAKGMVSMEQVHGGNVSFVTAGDMEDGLYSVDGVDGIGTDVPRVTLTCRTADCVPVILMDSKRRMAGIVHAGWKGTLLKIAQNMVSLMKGRGCTVRNMIAIVGPSIGPCCYNIQKGRRGVFKREFEEFATSVIEERRGKFFLNLAALNVMQLRKVGLDREKIDFFPFCTSCNRERFYSFRRDGTGMQKMISYAMIA